MTFRTLLGATMLATLALPALAGDITVEDAYARAATPNAKAGAAFLTIVNGTGAEDRLIAATTDAAARTELHTHKESDGVMMMMPVEGGFVIPAGGQHQLKRGGDHIMMMGLTRSLISGEEVELVLTFETAGEMRVTILVDNERKPDGH